MGGYDLSKMGKSQCCQSVYLSVGRSVGQSVSYNQLVRKKEKSVFLVTGKVVMYMYDRGKKEGSRRLYKYRKMPR